MNQIVKFAAAGLLACVAAVTSAQDAVVTKRAGVGAVSVQYVKFKPDTGAAVMAIEQKFEKAGMASNTPNPTIVHFQSGAWDAVYIFPLPGGLADLDYSTSASEAAFMNALAKSEGGMPAAKKLWADWSAMVDKDMTEIGHVHVAK